MNRIVDKSKRNAVMFALLGSGSVLAPSGAWAQCGSNPPTLVGCLAIRVLLGPGRAEIRLMDIPSGVVRTLPLPLPELAQVVDPEFSPDGQWLTFSGGPNFSDGIYIVRKDGVGLERLNPESANIVSPSWSPAGCCVVFHSVNGTMRFVFRDEAPPRQIHDTEVLAAFTRWSPSGTRVAYSNWATPTYNSDIFVYDIITRTYWQVNQRDGGEALVEPSWSPDGRRLAVQRRATPEATWDIWVMNADGSDAVNLTSDMPLSSEGGPVWSPDGHYILFTSDQPGNGDIFAMLCDGSLKSNLTNTPDVDESSPSLGRIDLCPADFNRDGVVNSQDFFDFVNAFFAGCQ